MELASRPGMCRLGATSWSGQASVVLEPGDIGFAVTEFLATGSQVPLLLVIAAI
jgi:hypothetical protein